MASFNKVILLGNLTRDPEVRYTPNGNAVANFAIAVNRKYKQGDDVKEEVSYIETRVSSWLPGAPTAVTLPAMRTC